MNQGRKASQAQSSALNSVALANKFKDNFPNAPLFVPNSAGLTYILACFILTYVLNPQWQNAMRFHNKCANSRSASKTESASPGAAIGDLLSLDGGGYRQ